MASHSLTDHVITAPADKISGAAFLDRVLGPRRKPVAPDRDAIRARRDFVCAERDRWIASGCHVRFSEWLARVDAEVAAVGDPLWRAA